MSEFASIEQLWEVHAGRPFPRALAGEEIDGQDLVLLDSSAAGCISAFVGDSGVHSLDSGRLRVLSDCVQGLSRACPQLPDEHRVYFDTLREISERVLRFCRRD